MTPGEFIKKLRIKQGWSLRKMAKKISVPVTTYKGWEDGRRISALALQKIAQVHGVSSTEIMGGNEQKKEALTRAIYYLDAAIDLIRQAQG